MSKVHIETIYRAVFQIILDFAWRSQEVTKRVEALEASRDIDTDIEPGRLSDCVLTVTLEGNNRVEVELARDELESWVKWHDALKYH